MVVQKIDKKVIEKVAMLARIELTDEEKELFSGQLEPVLEHIDKLNGVDTDGVDPTFQVLEGVNVLREDEVKASFDQKKALNGAPKTYNGFVATHDSLKN